MRLRAVIFDYGEVLSGPANPDAHRDMLAIAGLPEAVLNAAYWAHRLDYDAAILNGRAYWEKIGHDAGTQFTPLQVEQLMEQDTRMWMDINGPMLAWAGELQHAGLLTAILSNMGEDVLAAMRRRFVWLDDFDAHTWSCELGVVKPDPAVYLDVIQKLGVKPQEALFLDNLAENVLAAEAAGLHSIVFQDVEQLGRDLRSRKFDLPLPQDTVAH